MCVICFATLYAFFEMFFVRACVRVYVSLLSLYMSCLNVLCMLILTKSSVNQSSHLNAHSVEWKTAQSLVVRFVTCALK